MNILIISSATTFRIKNVKFKLLFDNLADESARLFFLQTSVIGD